MAIYQPAPTIRICSRCKKPWTKARKGKPARPACDHKDAPPTRVKRRSRAWWHEWRDGVVRHRDPLRFPDGSPVHDKKTALEMAAEREREREREKGGFGDPFKKHRARPLEGEGGHLADFETHLRARKVTDFHRTETMRHLQAFLASSEAARLADLERSAAETWLVRLSVEATGRRGEVGWLSARSLNRRRAALLQFGRWLVEARRYPFNPFAGLPTRNEDADRRHERRALSLEELERLLAAARRRPLEVATKPRTVRGKEVTPNPSKKERARLEAQGATRALVYALAARTGLRRSELLTLRWADVDLGKRPSVTVTAKRAKNRRTATVPLAAELAAALKKRRAADRKAVTVFTSSGFPTLRTLKADLETAGIPVVVDGLAVDFHALRTCFASALADQGVHPRTAQELLRHADVTTTMKHYTRVVDPQKREAVESVALGAGLGAGDREAAALGARLGASTANLDGETETYDGCENGASGEDAPSQVDAKSDVSVEAGEGIRTLDPWLGKPMLYH